MQLEGALENCGWDACASTQGQCAKEIINMVVSVAFFIVNIISIGQASAIKAAGETMLKNVGKKVAQMLAKK